MTASAQTDVREIPTGNGKVVIPAGLKQDVEQFHYAPARRAGDFVFLSGLVACNRSEEPMTEEAFCAELRNLFGQMEQLLRACDTKLTDVVELQMFHVLGSPLLLLDKAGQLAAISKVRDEFFPAPYAAAVELAVADLNPAGGLVEIKAVAFSPIKRA